VVTFLYVFTIVLNNLIRVFWGRPFRRWLDKLFLVAQSGIVLLFGLMIAIWLRGWDGDSPRWVSEGFSPFSGNSGYLDWFTVLFTFFFFIVIVLEGLGWTVHKVAPALARKFKFAIQRMAVYGLVLYILLVVSLYLLHKDLLHYYFVYPAWIVLPILTISAFSGLMAIRTYTKNNKGYFLATNLFIYFWLGLMVLKYPYLIRSVSGRDGFNIFETEFHDLAAYNGHWWVNGGGTSWLWVYSGSLFHNFSKGNSLREKPLGIAGLKLVLYLKRLLGNFPGWRSKVPPKERGGEQRGPHRGPKRFSGETGVFSSAFAHNCFSQE